MPRCRTEFVSGTHPEYPRTACLGLSVRAIRFRGDGADLAWIITLQGLDERMIRGGINLDFEREKSEGIEY